MSKELSTLDESKEWSPSGFCFGVSIVRDLYKLPEGTISALVMFAGDAKRLMKYEAFEGAAAYKKTQDGLFRGQMNGS